MPSLNLATDFIIIIIYLLRPWAAHKTYKDKKLKTTGTHTNRKR